MFVVSESEAAAIRTAFEEQGELSAAIELRRLFPGITDNLQARECGRASSPVGSRCRHALPGGFGPGIPEAVPRDARRHPVTPHGGPDLDHRFPLTVSAGRAYHGIGGAGSASGSFDQSHVQSLPAKRLGDKFDYPHAIAPGFKGRASEWNGVLP
jgi:hypothetical protein